MIEGIDIPQAICHRSCGKIDLIPVPIIIEIEPHAREPHRRISQFGANLREPRIIPLAKRVVYAVEIEPLFHNMFKPELVRRCRGWQRVELV